MDLRTLGPNQRELTLRDGTKILFSYDTPVAAYIPGRGFVRTDAYYSKTSTRHVNQWLEARTAHNAPRPVDGIPAAELAEIVKGAA